MRKLYLTIAIAIFSAIGVQAQIKSNLDWSKANTEQRKEMVKNMSATERKELLKKFRENMLVEDLKVPEKDREDFKKIYNEYQESQQKIKERFNNDFDPDKLSDAEAQQKLEESFDLAQKLVDNRKEYARKMQNVVKPQQVLKMFQNEGQMRDKMLDRRIESRDDINGRNPGSLRNNTPMQMRNNEMAPQMRQPSPGMRTGGGMRGGNR